MVSGEMGQDLSEVMKIRDHDTRAELDRTLAAASHAAVEAAKSALSSLPAVIQRAQAVLQQLTPPPQDPLAATEMAKIQSQSQTAREKLQARSQEIAQTLASTSQEADKKRQFDMAKDQERLRANAQHDQVTQRLLTMREDNAEQNENVRKAAELEAKERMNTADNTTALTIAEAETLADTKAAVENGSGINPNP
jgi:chromosome segregation ATPase